MNHPSPPASFARRAVRGLRRRLRQWLVSEPAPPRPKGPNRYNARSEADAIAVLPQLAELARGGGTVLVIGTAGAFRDAVGAGLQQRGVPFRAHDAAQPLTAEALAGIGCILLALPDSRSQYRLARALVQDPRTADIPLEYVALPRLDNAPLAEWDRYVDGDFVSPLLCESGPAYYDIYRESLTRFRQKTDIRDYLDLGQLLGSVTARRVAGNVAEFGSYQGHSGYLIARVLEHLRSDKRVFLFDMFENFPQENVGVDRFWSGTHAVDFESVRAKFATLPQVQLVKGDFTRTVLTTDTGPLAFAFIDCDSYRATQVLLEQLWDSRISPGGIVAMEDYGHAALLGNRLAVHQFFDGRRDAVTWFSQFSGFFIAIKAGPAAAP